MQDSTSSIFRSARLFLSGTLLSRMTGLIRDIAMAYAFGTHGSIAAFLLAFRFSHLFRRLLGEGALQTAFVPAFEKLRKDSPKRAALFFRDLNLSLSALLGLIVFGSMLFLGSLLQWSHLSAGSQEVVWLTLLMMPSLFFICLYGLNAGLLQCEKSYFTASIAPVAFNFFWIIGIFALKSETPTTAMSWMSLFIILSCLAQWLVTMPKTHRIMRLLSQENSIKDLWKGIRPLSPDILMLINPLLLGIVGIGASQINNTLDSLFARYADESGPALLWYAIRIQQLPLALFGIAISGALLPPLSRAIKASDFVQSRRFLDFALSRALAPMIPITCAFFVLGDTGLNLVYGRGHFDALSTYGTTLCLYAYGIGLIPMTAVLILAPALYAQGDYKTTTSASIISMLLNAFLNGVLIFGFSLGAASVALATSASAFVNVWLLSDKIKATIGPVYTPALNQSLLRMAKASVLASAGAIFLDHHFFGHSSITILYGEIPSYPMAFTEQILHFGCQSLSFTLFLCLAAYLFKAHELFAFFRFTKKSEIN